MSIDLVHRLPLKGLAMATMSEFQGGCAVAVLSESSWIPHESRLAYEEAGSTQGKAQLTHISRAVFLQGNVIFLVPVIVNRPRQGASLFLHRLTCSSLRRHQVL